MFGIGHWELLAVLAVILLLFGPRMLPKLMRSMGESITAFKQSTREAREALDELHDEK